MSQDEMKTLPRSGSRGPDRVRPRRRLLRRESRAGVRDLTSRTPGLAGHLRTERLFPESGDVLRSILDLLPDPVMRCRSDGILSFANRAFRRRFGIGEKSPLEGYRILDLLTKDRQAVELAITSLEHDRPQAILECVHGRFGWMQWTILAIYGPDGRVREYQASGRDVSSYRRAAECLRNSLADKEALLEEIHHRVKNNLQIISSILDLSGMEAAEPHTVEIIDDARSRIHTMALIHSQLMRSDRVDHIDVRQHITELMDYLFHMHEYTRNQIIPVLEIGDVYLNMNRAVPFGLVMHEILSNTFKHAFPGNAGGVIRIRITVEAGIVNAHIADSGIGFPEQNEGDRTGKFGMKLIELIVLEQLGGTLSVSGVQGAEYRITFPL